MIACLVHSLSEMPIGSISGSRYASLAVSRIILILLASEMIWYLILTITRRERPSRSVNPYGIRSRVSD